MRDTPFRPPALALVIRRVASDTVLMGTEPSEEPRTAKQSAGAFLAGFGEYAMPTHTMTDDVPGEPTALEAERTGATPSEPASNRLLDRLVRLTVLLVGGVLILWILNALGVI